MLVSKVCLYLLSTKNEITCDTLAITLSVLSSFLLSSLVRFGDYSHAKGTFLFPLRYKHLGFISELAMRMLT